MAWFAKFLTWLSALLLRIQCKSAEGKKKRHSSQVEIPDEVRRSVRDSITSTFTVLQARKIEFLPQPPKLGIQPSEVKPSFSNVEALFLAMFATHNAFDSVSMAANTRPTASITIKDETFKSEDLAVPEVTRGDRFAELFHEIRCLVRSPEGCPADKMETFKHLMIETRLDDDLKREDCGLEVIIGVILGSLLKLEPFLEYSNGIEAFCHQVAVFPQNLQSPQDLTLRHQGELQLLFQTSMIVEDVAFVKVPTPVLFIKISNRKQDDPDEVVIPNLRLDVTDFLESDDHILDLTRRHLYLLAVICKRGELHSTYCRMGFEVESDWIHFNASTEPQQLPNLGKSLHSALTSETITDHSCLQILSEAHMCIYGARDDFTTHSFVGYDMDQDEDVIYSAPSSVRLSPRTGRNSSIGDSLSYKLNVDSHVWKKFNEVPPAHAAPVADYTSEPAPSAVDRISLNEASEVSSVTNPSERSWDRGGSSDSEDEQTKADAHFPDIDDIGQGFFPTSGDILFASVPQILEVAVSRRASARNTPAVSAFNTPSGSRRGSAAAAAMFINLPRQSIPSSAKPLVSKPPAIYVSEHGENQEQNEEEPTIVYDPEKEEPKEPAAPPRGAPVDKLLLTHLLQKLGELPPPQEVPMTIFEVTDNQ